MREDNKKSWDNRADERARYDREMEPTYDYYFLKGDKENELMPAIDDAKLEYWAKVVSAQSEEEVEQAVHAWNQTCHRRVSRKSWPSARRHRRHHCQNVRRRVSRTRPRKGGGGLRPFST